MGQNTVKIQYCHFWVTLIMLVFIVYERFEKPTVDRPFIAQKTGRPTIHKIMNG